MSTLVMGACWPLELSQTVKAVLISLADQASDDGVCWPKISTIHKRTCMSPRAVQKALRALECCGALTVSARQRDNGSATSNLYTISLEWCEREAHRQATPCTTLTPPVHDVQGGGAPRSPPRCTTFRGVVHHVHPLNHQLNRQGNQIPPTPF